MRLTYFQEQSLNVELQYQVADEWTDCFETGPLKMPSLAYLGFSAETGELHDNHDILAVETWNMHVRDNPEGSKSDSATKGRNKVNAVKSGTRQESRGWGWFFIKIVLFFVVVVGGYVGFTMYRTSKRGSRF